jgi:histone H3/H4
MTQVRRFFREVYMEEIKPSAPLRMSEEAALALHQIFEHWIRGILEAAWTMCKADNRHTLQAKHLDTLHAVLRCSQSLFRYDPSVEKVVLQPGLNDSPIEWDVQRNEVQEETPAKKVARSTKQKSIKKSTKSVSVHEPEISFECESDQESEVSSENIVF